MKLELGQVVHNFVVERVLGSGGTAVVYLVRERGSSAVHALKVLTVSSPAIRERMRREGEVQSALSHPNIVPVQDVLDLDGSPALLMEYVEGPTLDAALKRYRLTLNDAELLFGGVLAGVHAAHASGLVHRDLKPANVLLASTVEGFVPKVTDFGLAKIMIDIPGLAHTKQGISMGTPSYMAPEQIRDAGSVDQRADIWSLGCLLYELMTRRRAFPGDEALAIYNNVVDASFAPPREWVPELPDRVDSAIMGCMQLDPAHRIPDCTTLLEVLQGRQEWDAKTGGRKTVRAWSDEEETADPLLEEALPAQFAADGPDRPATMSASGPSIGAELVMEAPGQPTAPGMHPSGGLQSADLVTDDDISPPIAVVQADTTGFDRQAAAMFDDEAPTVAVRLTELVPSQELPPRPPRPRATSADSIGVDSLEPPGPKASLVLAIGAVAVLLTALTLGASASVLSYVMNERGVTTLFATPAEVEEPAPPTVPATMVAPAPTVLPKPVALPSRPSPSPTTAPSERPVPPAKPDPTPTPAVIEASAPPATPPEPAPAQAPAPSGVASTDATTPEAVPNDIGGTAAPAETFTIRLLSHPMAATVTIDGQEKGRTPMKLELERGTYDVRLESNGMLSQRLKVDAPGSSQIVCYRFDDRTTYDKPCTRKPAP